MTRQRLGSDENDSRTDDYDHVFDKSGLSTSQVPFLLYAKDATDITAVLLAGINRDAPAEEAGDGADAGIEVPVK